MITQLLNNLKLKSRWFQMIYPENLQRSDKCWMNFKLKKSCFKWKMTWFTNFLRKRKQETTCLHLNSTEKLEMSSTNGSNLLTAMQMNLKSISSFALFVESILMTIQLTLTARKILWSQILKSLFLRLIFTAQLFQQKSSLLMVDTSLSGLMKRLLTVILQLWF